MVFFPDAKINLGLNILSVRPDGYHEVETVMVPVPGLYDVLEIVRRDAPGAAFIPSGLTVDCPPEENLCLRAYGLMQEKYGIGGAVLLLHKRIPFGAGLGGGSADAAFTIRGLNAVFSLGLTEAHMEELAAELGSDTAFFIRNRPALATGRGERLAPVSVNLEGHSVLLVKPGLHISTREAYAGVVPRPARCDLKQTVEGDMRHWKERLTNDFEPSLFPKYPELARIKQTLYELGAEYASLSGSGSTVFGIFPGKAKPEHPFSSCFTFFQAF